MISFPSTQASAPRYKTWTHARVARLAFLVGLGCDSREIAADAIVAVKPAAVRRQARRLGLALRAAAGPRLPYAILSRYEAAALRRGTHRDALIHRILLNAGSDDDLIDNILDDRG